MDAPKSSIRDNLTSALAGLIAALIGSALAAVPLWGALVLSGASVDWLTVYAAIVAFWHIVKLAKS